MPSCIGLSRTGRFRNVFVQRVAPRGAKVFGLPIAAGCSREHEMALFDTLDRDLALFPQIPGGMVASVPSGHRKLR
jgi:hypothetical protein